MSELIADTEVFTAIAVSAELCQAREVFCAPARARDWYTEVSLSDHSRKLDAPSHTAHHHPRPSSSPRSLLVVSSRQRDFNLQTSPLEVDGSHVCARFLAGGQLDYSSAHHL